MSAAGLRIPPKLKPDTLRVIPLGGLGDVGRNMASLEINGKILLIDCGVLFPDEAHPGVDLILPGIEAIRDRIDDVVGLVLTHGHEDHIGAVPYLLRLRNDIPVFGSRLTLALLREKLKEHRIRNTDLREVEEGSIVTVPEFELEFLAVNHSIPDALAVFLRTAAGTVLHTGDFKMDQLPLDGRLTDLRAFARLGEEGVDLFMVDSTNAEVPGFTTPEKDIQPALQRVFATSRQRLIVACFASHVHRVQQVLDEAVRHGRKVVYVGRSMVRNMSIARDLGYLKVPGNTLIELKDLEKYKPEDVVIISTGSQGEPLSALSRIANREHPVIELKPGDTVLLASSLIPGNENSVYRVINGLTKLGARVVHKGNAMVHVSGHASAGELLYCYNIVKPRNVMPVHGEVRHLVANAELAQATGVRRDHTVIVEDGDVVDLHDGKVSVVGRIDASYVFVDGSSVGDISETELTDRKILGEEGFISVLAVVNVHTNQIVSGPEINARGFVGDDAVFDGIRGEISEALVQAMQEGVDDSHRLQQVIRRKVGRWVNKTHRRRPMIIPIVVAT
ncbi:ribonuclease J [Enemella evansiae]|uniref:Ribonuclease J n=1 Tax=Enemella evansiae TaxID=2016499 RepID=A0A255G659_9ACTN|nr:ribonuclease J [Enemella evansiae]PFG66726.1 ribonuclease J [Propionibacteriaceae bacterium ES.041]OYN93543.1 RNase J family beta-CASP ribonuclease [Enemella evansiae]OYN93714.1 RNase J family beta-CASP ribonuclease [Enemella evansiae]OYO05792.1 RNase J family beta-CASP ribonuclease [Enemella evansiae]OYO09703.1 RNase J family beta-CASP ribonuclease [Enemella evansiae]